MEPIELEGSGLKILDSLVIVGEEGNMSEVVLMEPLYMTAFPLICTFNPNDYEEFWCVSIAQAKKKNIVHKLCRGIKKHRQRQRPDRKFRVPFGMIPYNDKIYPYKSKRNANGNQQKKETIARANHGNITKI